LVQRIKRDREQIADGYATYVVVDNKKNIGLEHIEFGDGYRMTAAGERGTNKDDVIAQMQWEKKMAEYFKKKKK
jgi:hypothetical protein